MLFKGYFLELYDLNFLFFPVVMCRCESWMIKKAERWKIDAFELWCWRRLLRVRWTARRSNQSILKEINPGYSLEGLKLKLQYFGHLMWRTDSLEKTLMLGKTQGGERRGRQMMRWEYHRLDGHEFEQAPGVGDGQGCLECCSPWGCKESDMIEWTTFWPGNPLLEIHPSGILAATLCCASISFLKWGK